MNDTKLETKLKVKRRRPALGRPRPYELALARAEAEPQGWILHEGRLRGDGVHWDARQEFPTLAALLAELRGRGLTQVQLLSLVDGETVSTWSRPLRGH